jgi:zona occludens toxin
MIHLITGLPGSGKSLYTLKKVKDRADKEQRPVFYHGIPELTLDWHLMESADKWVECPKGSIIVIDECQSTFRPRAVGSQVPLHVSQLETHRHDGHDLYLITQHPMLVDSNLRRLVNYHYHVERFFGFAKSKIHEFHKVRENVDKSTKNSIETHFVYPKEVYTWYKSADMHTVKKRIPMRLVLMVVLPLLVIALLYYGYTVLHGGVQGHVLENNKDLLPMEQGGAPFPDSHGFRSEKIAYTWGESQRPRVPDLPFTAPKYDEITKPVMAPRIAAAVLIRGTCTAYTQQGTKIAMDDAVCRQFVENGMFQDFDDGSAKYAKDQYTLNKRELGQNALSDAQRPKGETVGPAAVAVIPDPAQDEESARSPSNRVRESQSQNRYPNQPQPYATGS